MEFLAVEDLVDVPAEVVLDPHSRSDVHVGGLREFSGMTKLLGFTSESVAKCYYYGSMKHFMKLYRIVFITI